MINNRQNGRRRGRGGPRPQGMDNRPNGGNNRPEPRSRGNAPQLHEKYKAMARDAQLAGDRVQTEYYLQFADHYFRILNETRARFDEQRPRGADNGRDDNGQGGQYRDEGRDDNQNDDYEDEDGEAMMADDEPAQNGRYEESPRPQPRGRDGGTDRGGTDRTQNGRPQRDDRPQQDNRSQRDDRPLGDDRPQRDTRPDREARPNREERPQRVQPTRSFEPVPDTGAHERGTAPERDARPQRLPPVRVAEEGAARLPRNRARPPEDDGDGPGIDLDRLPPAIARLDSTADAAADNDAGAVNGDDVAPRPTRRPRRPRESTPAAA